MGNSGTFWQLTLQVLVHLGECAVYFRNFAPDYRLVAMMSAEADGASEAGHYIAEKRHTMLCRLADGTSEILYACQRHCRVGCHGYAERVSRCVREG